MTPKVERITDSFELGEGPHWDAASQCLYFVDIFGKSINRYVPASKKHTKAIIGINDVSIIIPIDGQKNKFIISVGRELYTITWDGESEKVSEMTKLGEVDDTPGILDNRFNDGKCDRNGRLWIGTMGSQKVYGYVEPDRGSLFSFDSTRKFKKHINGVSLSNGLAWSSNNTKFYYIDSPKRAIHQFDFDIKNGTLSNGTTVFTLDTHNIPGLPDGMAIDTDGNLWVAVYDSYSVIKIDPRRPETLLERIKIPAKQVTSVAFGGPNLDELYVTTASFTVDGVVLSPPDHGAVYRITGVGAKGFAGVNVKL